jgi:hypothetical protein
MELVLNGVIKGSANGEPDADLLMNIYRKPKQLLPLLHPCKLKTKTTQTNRSVSLQDRSKIGAGMIPSVTTRGLAGRIHSAVLFCVCSCDDGIDLIGSFPSFYFSSILYRTEWDSEPPESRMPLSLSLSFSVSV